MTNIHFQSTEDFQHLFSKKNRQVCDSIVEGIEKAMQDNKKSAFLFTLSFDKHDHAYEITLPQAAWEVAVEECLAYYHKNDLSDKAIDTWKLLEAIKVW